MDMQTIVEDWKANAEKHSDRNFNFLHGLKMKSDRAVDRVAHRLHEEAFSIIDCTQCANCCKTISPMFRKSDVRRIAEHLGIKATDFTTQYLKADEDGDLFLKNVPCPFLGADNLSWSRFSDRKAPLNKVETDLLDQGTFTLSA